MSRSAEEVLEFDKLRELLRLRTTCAPGRRAVEELAFSRDAEFLRGQFALIREALALFTDLDAPPHEFDLHLDPHVERLGVGDGRDRRDLAHLDTAKDDRCPDVQALDGAVKKQEK